MNRKLLATLASLVTLIGVSAPVVAEEVVLISTHTRDFIGAEAGVKVSRGCAGPRWW